ncbi:hypothetical protein [Paraburkholderia sp. C35]|uniref:hypothetical protein n=1 Tax=Paraburkholderia sp. C35 TaxID=2126993 RepID=UPI0013A559FF|nr:hypothetical protein [Paraburkholderia sp. C35]
MNTVVNECTALLTIPLGMDDLNEELALEIMEDCRQAEEPSSYKTTASEIFNRTDLDTDEQCIVIALPGINSVAAPPSIEPPTAIVLQERNDGKGTAYLQLRTGQVLLEKHTLGAAKPDSRYLLLYLFDDRPVLDVVPASEALQGEMWRHEVSAQSRHFFDASTPQTEPVDRFHLPVVIRRAMVISEDEATADDDISDSPDYDHEEVIPF